MRARHRLVAGLFVLAACHGSGPPTPDRPGGSATSPAPPPPTHPASPEATTPDAGPGAEPTAASDATAPDAPAAAAPAAPPRPVVFLAFRRSGEYGRADRVSPRSAVPDGEPDAVFELVLDGDVTGLVLLNAASSTSARTETPAGATPTAGPERPRVIPITKHAPELFAFGDADAGVVTLPSRGGRRRLLLHTWAPPAAVDWRVFAVLPDGSIKPGPTTR